MLIYVIGWGCMRSYTCLELHVLAVNPMRETTNNLLYKTTVASSRVRFLDFVLTTLARSLAMQAPQVGDYHGPQPVPPVAVAPAASSSFRNDVYPPAFAPSTLRAQPPLPAPWSTGLFDCCDDVGNCKPSYFDYCCLPM